MSNGRSHVGRSIKRYRNASLTGCRGFHIVQSDGIFACCPLCVEGLWTIFYPIPCTRAIGVVPRALSDNITIANPYTISPCIPDSHGQQTQGNERCAVYRFKIEMFFSSHYEVLFSNPAATQCRKADRFIASLRQVHYTARRSSR